MGEARRKKDRRKAFFEQHPFCCFCGGDRRATTVDHVPSRQMFSLKARPRGLEVPACAMCNSATRQHEQVAAMFGRIFPDGGTEAERNETQQIISAVNRNNPGLLEEMRPSQDQLIRSNATIQQIKDVAGALNCSGPLVNKSIQIFGAKLGLALQYAEAGRIVPKAGGVAVLWYTNYDAVTGALPSQVFRFLGPDKTLEQGKWSVRDQFGYAAASSDDGSVSTYYTTFRKSFAVLCWVAEDAARFQDLANIHRPGEF